jgi:NAD(P)-dependent dehydrogenase (short-subunit alcohol dehydrogenase family)
MADETIQGYDSVSYRSLSGRVVLVTGGASGIGAEMVRAFVSQNARVAFIDIDEHAAQALTAQLPLARYHCCDLRDIDGLRRTIANIEQHFGRIDVLVSNAGKDDRHDFRSVEPAYWSECLALNLNHHFFAAQAVARGMESRGSGSLILLGSVSWMRGRPGLVGYTTAKAGINGLTRTLARELGPAGIRVNCLVPGAISTQRQRRLWLTPELNQQYLDLQALKFRLAAEHVARMALFLASDESRGCTGANFIVDAGLTQN